MKIVNHTCRGLEINSLVPANLQELVSLHVAEVETEVVEDLIYNREMQYRLKRALASAFQVRCALWIATILDEPLAEIKAVSNHTDDKGVESWKEAIFVQKHIELIRPVAQLIADEVEWPLYGKVKKAKVADVKVITPAVKAACAQLVTLGHPDAAVKILRDAGAGTDEIGDLMFELAPTFDMPDE
tara:strand:+ start:9656 stop:10213 length:558 start_codon:yes stop_codon:yes gene_type:complete